MREKKEYYATIYVTDDSFRFSCDWHNQIHSAQLSYNGDYYKNIANAINKNYINKQTNEWKYMYPERYSVLLSKQPKVIGTDETAMFGAEYRGTLIVKLLLDPSQIKTLKSFPNHICLNSQISANDVYGVYVESLFPSYKF